MRIKNNKNVKLMGLGLLILIMITAIGITYSYYFIGIDGSSTTSKINIQAGELNSIVLRGLTSDLYLDVSVDDMSLKNLKSYYSTDTKEDKYNTSPVEYKIAELGIVGNITEKNKCTGSIKVEMDTQENSMGSVLKEDDAYIYIKGSNVNEKLDLSSLKEENNSKIYNIEFLITDNTPQYIKAYMELQNKETGQNYIAGKMLNVTITIDSFKCKGDSEAPTITKFYVNNENQQPKYTNNSNIIAYLEWKDEDATEYCVTSEQGNCDWLKVSEDQKRDKKLQQEKTLVGTGEKILYAYLKDEVGNESTPSNDTIIIDKDEPTIDTTQTKVDNITETTAEITVVASDTLSGVKQYCYGTNDTTNTKDFKCVNYNTNGNNIIKLSDLISGAEYTYYIYVTDNAGNSTIENKTAITFTTVKKLASEVVIEQASGQIQDTPVEGDTLRRFQGSNVTKNYICFGTSDKDICTTKSPDKFMYRIIGVDTTTNQLKIIKKEALDTTYYWHNTTGSTYTWGVSDLQKGLNGEYFLSNTTFIPNTNILNTSTTWSNAIENHTWSYGDITTYNDTATNILKAEQTAWASGSNKGTVQAKIGLMYLSDYYLAVSNTANCNSDYSTCKASWIHYSNNDSSMPSSYEWTMSSRDGTRAWYVYVNGRVGGPSLDNTYAVRPVFYLKSTIVLDGDGSIGNPYRIVNAAPTIEKVEVTSDNKTSFTVKVTADNYATRYCYKLDNEKDYKCTNSNTNEFINVDTNTNYTISVYVENKNGLRSEVKETFRIPTGNKVVENSDHGNGEYGTSGVTEVTDPLEKRFYGEDPNNYICFGANTCENNSDYMYRIIGATSDGKLKIMKQKSLGTKTWHDSTGVTWETARLRSDINDSLFYNNKELVPDNYKQYIDPNPQWCIGDVTSYSTGSKALTQEIKTCKQIASSPISLANLSDHYFAYKDGKGGQNCNSSPYCKSWMTYTETQWTMSRYDDAYAWLVYDNGRVGIPGLNSTLAVRPVFYLKSTVKLSGSGSSTDPFIITGLAS